MKTQPFKNLKNARPVSVAAAAEASKKEETAQHIPAIPDRPVEKPLSFEEKMTLAKFVATTTKDVVGSIASAVRKGQDAVYAYRLQVVEKNPELASKWVDCMARIDELNIAAQEKSEQLSKEMYLGTVQAVFGTLNQVVGVMAKVAEKTDLGPLVAAAAARLTTLDRHTVTAEEREQKESEARIAREAAESQADVQYKLAQAEYYRKQAEHEQLRCEEKRQDIAERQREREEERASRRTSVKA